MRSKRTRRNVFFFFLLSHSDSENTDRTSAKSSRRVFISFYRTACMTARGMCDTRAFPVINRGGRVTQQILIKSLQLYRALITINNFLFPTGRAPLFLIARFYFKALCGRLSHRVWHASSQYLTPPAKNALLTNVIRGGVKKERQPI